jgi:hypothetical protein
MVMATLQLSHTTAPHLEAQARPRPALPLRRGGVQRQRAVGARLLLVYRGADVAHFLLAELGVVQARQPAQQGGAVRGEQADEHARRGV